MGLRTKCVILISLIVLVSFGVTFYRTSTFQHELVLSQVAKQARILHKQILLTRQWISDHNGLFIMKQPGVEANPFLEFPEMEDVSGQLYVMRNPAMVTRELSEYADREGFCSFRVTTLHPINPANVPDAFEERSLRLFEQGASEVLEIVSGKEGKILRYISPLLTEDSCLECHAEQGYKAGDIRGGLSVSIPIDKAFTSIAENNRMLLYIGVITIVLVGACLYLVIDLLVVRRLQVLFRAMEKFPENVGEDIVLPGGNDEIGRLGKQFGDLRYRFHQSRQELEATREQVCQSEKLAALGRLTSGIAHEINNPLGGMQNCVKSMVEAPEDMEMRERYLKLLAKGLARIGQTVRKLLDFGRQSSMCYQTWDVDEIVRECLELLGYSLKNIELRLNLNIGKQYTVDVEALRQIIVNIILNAVQAMPEGGDLVVSTEDIQDNILLRFEDTGIGISEDHLDKIFDPFFTTKEVGEGTGLGLSVSHSLVQRLGGNISVQSRKGRGTEFTVTLPKSVPGSDGQLHEH